MKLYQSNSASSERSRGFTLLELMTVVAILSVLTTVAVPAFVRQMRRGHTVEAVEGLDKIAAGAKVYFHNHEAFPASSASWVPAMDHPTACANHAGQIPAAGAEFDVDPWKSLLFIQSDRLRYRYRWTHVGSGGAATDEEGVAHALGDLDCDTTVSLWRVALVRRSVDGFLDKLGPYLQTGSETE